MLKKETNLPFYASLTSFKFALLAEADAVLPLLFIRINFNNIRKFKDII
jgi:hypothetical protein